MFCFVVLFFFAIYIYTFVLAFVCCALSTVGRKGTQARCGERVVLALFVHGTVLVLHAAARCGPVTSLKARHLTTPFADWEGWDSFSGNAKRLKIKGVRSARVPRVCGMRVGSKHGRGCHTAIKHSQKQIYRRSERYLIRKITCVGASARWCACETTTTILKTKQDKSVFVRRPPTVRYASRLSAPLILSDM